MKQFRLLVLGMTGMLGSSIFREFSRRPELIVSGTMRSSIAQRYFVDASGGEIITGLDVLNNDELSRVISEAKPDVIVNCIGLVKQLENSNDPVEVLPINSMFPHRLSQICKMVGAKLIHISTDCVFSGKRGRYVENDEVDAQDLYGMSKYLGEIRDQSHVITLRTSIIGHELNSAHSLIDWFLSQQGQVKGFSKAVFSGLPTVELANVIAEYVIPNEDLRGLYHISSEPIDKYELLSLVKRKYQKAIKITPDDELIIDRSLDSSRFKAASGYVPPVWPVLVEKMYSDYSGWKKSVS